jgi:hypothetical protein
MKKSILTILKKLNRKKSFLLYYLLSLKIVSQKLDYLFRFIKEREYQLFRNY